MNPFNNHLDMDEIFKNAQIPVQVVCVKCSVNFFKSKIGSDYICRQGVTMNKYGAYYTPDVNDCDCICKDCLEKYKEIFIECANCHKKYNKIFSIETKQAHDCAAAVYHSDHTSNLALQCFYGSKHDMKIFNVLNDCIKPLDPICDECIDQYIDRGFIVFERESEF